METHNATPGGENLPGQEFRDRNGRGFAEFVAASGGSTRWIGRWSVRRTESTGSTNADLEAAAVLGAPDRLVLVADHQTAGRGRLDRRWEAPPGANLLVSILFRTVPSRPHRLTQAVAMAALSACRRVAGETAEGLDISLKWPNDIVIGSRKLAGILASASTSRSTRVVDDVEVIVPDHVVVGLGLNVQWAPEEAVSLAEYRADVHRDDVLAALLESLDDLMDQCLVEVHPGEADPARRRADEFHDRYQGSLSTIGREVRVELPSGEILEGRALGVGIDGRLEVLDTCAISHHVDVADIVHLRLADSPSPHEGRANPT